MIKASHNYLECTVCEYASSPVVIIILFAYANSVYDLVDIAGWFLAELATVWNIPESKLLLIVEAYKNVVCYSLENNNMPKLFKLNLHISRDCSLGSRPLRISPAG